MMKPAQPEDLFALLDRLGLAHETVSHAPVFTVAEGAEIKASMAGGHTKNLFVKDKKGALFLVSALDSTRIDLNALAKVLGAGRFSFGSAALLEEKLGVTPGSVTAFAAINDPAQAVTLVLDEALFGHEIVNFHPLRNDATTAISPQGILSLCTALGRRAIRVAFPEHGPPRIVEDGAAY